MKDAEAALSGEVNFGEVDCDQEIPLAQSIRLLNVPAVAYYRDGKLVAVLPGVQQDIRRRLERLLRGEPIGRDDGMDGR
jgi:thioredoxin-like negative regulator of GroEL